MVNKCFHGYFSSSSEVSLLVTKLKMQNSEETGFK